MLSEKADVLFLIIGGNPFPNLISVATRLKKGGRVVCVCTKDTESNPYIRFRKLLMNKLPNISIEKIVISELNISDIKREIEKKLQGLTNPYLQDEISLLELNYTGGIKLISTTAYHVIKNFDYDKYNKNIHINLTYIDPEQERLYFESLKENGKDYTSNYVPLLQLDSNFDLNIKDILSVYSDINNIVGIDENGARPQYQELANRLGNLFCDIDKEKYDERIKFFEEDISTKGYIKNEQVDYEGYKKDLIKAFQDHNIYSHNEIHLLEKLDSKQLFNYMSDTKWLEEYILNILIELKDEGIIEDIQKNIQRVKEDEEQGPFEVDLVAYRKYKLFAISITFINTQEEAKGKLYEIKQRAIHLAGDESGPGYICLSWETEDLKTNYRNIWENEKVENSLILGAQDFSNLKDKLRAWLKVGS